MMEGVRICPVFRYPKDALRDGEEASLPHEPPIPDDVSDFAFFFRDVLAELDRLIWISGQDNPLRCGAPDALWETLQPVFPLPAPGGCDPVPCWLFPEGFLVAHAGEIRDDWNELFGFSQAPADWQAWFAERLFYVDRHYCDGGSLEDQPRAINERRARHIESTVQACFLNVDGCYWEFFAKDGHLLDRVRQRCLAIAGLRVEEVSSLTDCVAL
jgi:hypothetical protein